MARRDLIRMTNDEVEAFLAERHTLNVATHGPDGSIHLVAMWYGFLDGTPAFETYAKSQKVLNVRRDPRMTCLVEDGARYEELRGVELVGTAVVLDEPTHVITVARSVVERYFPTDSAEEAEAIAAGLATKRVAIRLDVERVVSWDHRKLGGTY
ncbi:PPOX class F420-dependent oxidoreductase [soil metagenome]